MSESLTEDALKVSLYTPSGGRIRPFDPSPDSVQLEDIAHALSNVCRFSGGTEQFYSVALHSLYVSEELANRGAGPRRRLYGLMHDASEAYLSDLAGPLKRQLRPYRVAERRVMDAVWTVVGVPPLDDADADAVHDADIALRAYETDRLLPVDAGDASEVAERYDLLADQRTDVRAAFLDRARTLLDLVDDDDKQ